MIIPEHVIPLVDMDTSLIKEVEAFAREVGSSGGITIIYLNVEKDDVFYLWGSSKGVSDFHSFSSKTSVEDPKTYMRVSSAKKQLDKSVKEFRHWNPNNFYLAFWVHPDSGNPIDKYVKVSGNRFPGSPRR